MTLQEILDALAGGEDLASVLSQLGPDVDLVALESEALQAFDGLRSGEALDDDGVRQLETLASTVEAIRGEQASRGETAAERAAQVDAIAARVSPPQSDAADTSGDDGQDDVGDAGSGADGDGGAGAEGVAAETPEPVTASGSGKPRVDLGRIARRVKRPVQPASGSRLGEVAFAAADVPGVPTGASYGTMTEMARAAERRFQAMPLGKTGIPRIRRGLAVLRKQVPDHLVATGSEADHEVIDRAADESRLPGGSLLASGGWCAPSETLYDLCELESTDGLYMLPEITAARGGVRHSQGPDFCMIFDDDCYWTLSETEVDAGEPEKPCCEIECPEFVDQRLDALGVCVTAGILTRRGYPELVARILRGALVAHAHRMSTERLNRVIAGSDNYGTLDVCGGATASVLKAIELQAEDMKYQNRLPRAATLELVAPFWLRGVIREDLSKRMGVDLLSITDEMINALFRLRGVSVQWTYSLDPIGDCPGSPPDLNVSDWPSTVRLVMYVAGTWVAATSDIITLDTIYDSMNIRTNRYTALFTEEGLAVLKRCHDSRLFSVPVCPSGETGASVDCGCESPSPS